MNTFISNISDNSEPYVKVSEAELHSIDEGLEEAKKGVFIPQGEGECRDGKGECGDRKSEGMMEKCNGNHYWVGYL